MSGRAARGIEERVRSELDSAVARRIPRLVVVDTIDSTNAGLRRLADDGAPAWTVLLSDGQTAGRGSRGRTWHSPPGLGLYASVLIRTGPEDDPWLLPRWTFVAALAACEACRGVSGLDVIVKWPNDLLVGDRKVGGVLAEARSSQGAGGDLVVGIGINVCHARDDFPAELRDVASSLQDAAGGSVMPRERLAARLLERLLHWADRLREGSWEEISRAWLARAPGAVGSRVRVARAGVAGPIGGVSRGIDASGALRVEEDGGTILLVRSGDAVMVEA